MTFFLARIFPNLDWVNLRIQFECWKIRTRKNFGHFLRSDPSSKKLNRARPKKQYSCFQKWGWRKKSSPERPQKDYFYQLTFLSVIAWREKRKFIQINLLVEIFLFACVLFKQKVCILMHIQHMRAGRWEKNFHPADFWKQD